MDRIHLSPPYMCGNEQKYVQEAFDTNWIAPLGPQVTSFEKELAERTGVLYALATSSGTAAIHLALRYYGVETGDFVFCSDLTFAGSCNPIMYQNATPVFIDSEPNSLNMSPVALQNAFDWAEKEGKLPKAVIIVDLYGRSADYDKLIPICKKHNVPVIEDAAEALGATYKGKPCGSFGDIGIFSFNGNKIVTTSGGGMAVSNNKQAIDKMLFWATQARESELHYEHKEFGYNYRLSNVCAAIGRGQLEGLNKKMERRKEIYTIYKELLEHTDIKMMPIYEEGTPNYWMSVALLNTSSKIMPHEICKALNEKNIEARPAWKPMHMQPVFKDCPYFAHELEVGKEIFKYGFCVPTGEMLTEQQQQNIVSIIKELL